MNKEIIEYMQKLLNKMPSNKIEPKSGKAIEVDTKKVNSFIVKFLNELYKKGY